ncbi:MAG: hypothetical protein R2711_11965 [Acidimicrobiales bacterium]
MAILMGSVYLILATNSGARLGQLALTSFFAWMTVMGTIWSIPGIGPKGPAPTWKVVDTVRTAPCTSLTSADVPDGCDEPCSPTSRWPPVPLPSQLPDPVEVRDGNDVLLAAFPTQRDPGLGDLVTVEGPGTRLLDEIDEQADPWRLLETSNRIHRRDQAVVAESLGPDDQALFDSASDYVVIESFLTGSRPRDDDSILGRIQYKITRTLDVAPDPFYAAVQLQAVIPEPSPARRRPPPCATRRRAHHRHPPAHPDQPAASSADRRHALLRRRDRRAVQLAAPPRQASPGAASGWA